MLNPELLRRDTQRTRTELLRRDDDSVRAFDEAVSADEAWRELTVRVETLRAERKQRASARRGKPSPEEIEEEQTARHELARLEDDLRQAEAKRKDALSWVPNLPDASVPKGKDDSENEVLRVVGEQHALPFEPLPHWDLAERLGILDLQAGANLSGARFFVLKGAGAMLQRALLNFMLDVHVHEQGYTEVHTPYMVREEIMYGSG